MIILREQFISKWFLSEGLMKNLSIIMQHNHILIDFIKVTEIIW